ncbi:deoxynucleotidyltransferase terminal-interacting protein 2-like [Dreissena polymorpha]|uniref:Fcf2 pre-rRNA processing C-terminal domain-containing protein n=1 Tax=Dreissena polymorpha TaxID=45954 RepID=A0A9D4J5K4_DREPO|nr:deoxynucleotidyltransferase terminal-interacting protein 2-like [Dreissena polymorpha]KAH3796147.1 hypothetical protein DPMN_149714 [Dreissena polymorpha]
MSQESDVSSSGSDSECDEADLQSVKEVFNAMKLKMRKLPVENKANSSLHTPNTSSFGNRLASELRSKLFETFNENDTDSGNDDSKRSDRKSEKSDNSSGKIDNFGFFIDKGFGFGETTEVISFDLSTLNTSSRDNDNEEVKGPEPHVKTKRKKGKKSVDKLSSQLKCDVDMNDIYINVDPYNNPKAKTNVSNFIRKEQEPEVMKKCVITDDFEKQDAIATTHVSVRKQKKDRKIEREKTKGSQWFNMPSTELTDERKYDLEVLQMRKVLDPKRFYKANDLKVAPKYFQFGKVIEDATDFYSSRIPKKQRKSTIVEELLADSQFRQFNKRKYEEVQEAKRQGKGPYKHMKRLKKRKR